MVFDPFIDIAVRPYCPTRPSVAPSTVGGRGCRTHGRKAAADVRATSCVGWGSFTMDTASGRPCPKPGVTPIVMRLTHRDYHTAQFASGYGKGVCAPHYLVDLVTGSHACHRVTTAFTLDFKSYHCQEFFNFTIPRFTGHPNTLGHLPLSNAATATCSKGDTVENQFSYTYGIPSQEHLYWPPVGHRVCSLGEPIQTVFVYAEKRWCPAGERIPETRTTNKTCNILFDVLNPRFYALTAGHYQCKQQVNVVRSGHTPCYSPSHTLDGPTMAAVRHMCFGLALPYAYARYAGFTVTTSFATRYWPATCYGRGVSYTIDLSRIGCGRAIGTIVGGAVKYDPSLCTGVETLEPGRDHCPPGPVARHHTPPTYGRTKSGVSQVRWSKSGGRTRGG